METKICEHCKKEFAKPKWKCINRFIKQIYCSNKCYTNSNKWKPTWNKWLKWVQKGYWTWKKRSIETCKKIWDIHRWLPARNRWLKTPIEVRKKQSTVRKWKYIWEHNPFRKWGKSESRYNGRWFEYKVWRYDVYKRDRFTCQWPWCGYKGKDLECHHIKKWKEHESLRFEVTNWITLCKKHHNKTRCKEEQYEELFTSITKMKWKK